VWSYGFSSEFTAPITLYTLTRQDGINGPNAQYWLSPTNNAGDSPAAEYNNGPAYADGNIDFLANEFVLVASSRGEYSDLIFTAPADGLYSLTSTFRGDQHGVGTLAGVILNGNVLFSGTVTALGQLVPFSDDLNLAAGDTLVFSVGPGGGDQNTGLDATITTASAEAPEPSPLRLFLLGASLGAVSLAYRRKRRTVPAPGRCLLLLTLFGQIALVHCLTPSVTAATVAASQPNQASSACVASPPNLLVDPDFQAGCNVSGIATTPGFWGFNNDQLLYTGAISGFPCCATESYYLPDPGGTSAGSANQIVDTIIGQLYDVSFELATNDVSPGALATVRFAGVIGLSETNAQLGLAPYQFQTFSFRAVATASQSEFAFIGFGSTQTPDYSFYLTNASVTPAVEPSSFALCCAVFAIVLAEGFRRRPRSPILWSAQAGN
jgi:hypothetical protein